MAAAAAAEAFGAGGQQEGRPPCCRESGGGGGRSMRGEAGRGLVAVAHSPLRRPGPPTVRACSASARPRSQCPVLDPSVSYVTPWTAPPRQPSPVHPWAPQPHLRPSRCLLCSHLCMLRHITCAGSRGEPGGGGDGMRGKGGGHTQPCRRRRFACACADALCVGLASAGGGWGREGAKAGEGCLRAHVPVPSARPPALPPPLWSCPPARPAGPASSALPHPVCPLERLLDAVAVVHVNVDVQHAAQRQQLQDGQHLPEEGGGGRVWGLG